MRGPSGTLVEYTERMALHLASRFIRVNTIHPTNCNTHLLHNEGLYKMFRPDLENPTREDVEPAFNFFQAMPIPYIEPEDIANLALFLASDESRYITGQQIRVDAGSLLDSPTAPPADAGSPRKVVSMTDTTERGLYYDPYDFDIDADPYPVWA